MIPAVAHIEPAYVKRTVVSELTVFQYSRTYRAFSTHKDFHINADDDLTVMAGIELNEQV